MISLRIVARRILRHWRMLLTVLIGVTVACALFGSAPLYSVAVTELGLRHTLATSHPTMVNIQAFGEEALTEGFYGQIRESISWLITDRVTVYHAPADTVQRPRVSTAGQQGRLPDEADRLLGIVHLTRPTTKIEMIDGRLPITPTLGREGCEGLFAGIGCCVQNEAARSVVIPEEPLPFRLATEPSAFVEAVANADLAASLGLRLGDLVPVRAAPNYVLKIVGFAAPINAAADYWVWENGLFVGPQPDYPGLLGGLHVSPQDYDCLAEVTAQGVRFYALSDLDEHVNVVQGRLPRYVEPPPTSPNDLTPPRQTIELITGPRTAEIVELGVGDRLILGGEMEIGPKFEFVLVGLVEPKDPTENYWMGELKPFEGDPQSGALHAFIPPQAMTQQYASGSEGGATKSWRLLVDRSQVTFATMDRVEATLRNLTSGLKQRDSKARLVTGLSDVIATYRGKLESVRTPLFLLLAEVLALVLYYLATTAALVLDQELNELAVLRSRGSSLGHLLRLQFLEAIFLCAPAAVAGPYVASWGLRWLYVLLVPAGLSGGRAPLYLEISHDARVMASIAAGLCVVALLLPVIPSARRSIVAWKALMSRPPQRSAWQRFYLDLFLLGVGGMLYWQLRSSGSFLSRRLSGTTFADPLLLITPALFLLAAALVLLRLFPPLLALVGRALGRLRGASVTLGIWQVSRNPVHYSRLMLLLTLTVGLGLFTTLYRTSLEASQQARARLEVGTDARITSADSVLLAIPLGQPLWERAAALPETKAASPVFRQEVSFTSGQVGSSLLAVDPATFRLVARYESGKSPVSIAQLTDILASDLPSAVGIPLPGQPNRMGAWLLPLNEESGYVALEFVLRDAAWRFVTVPVTPPDPARLEWQFLEGAINTATDTGWPIAYPLNWIATRVLSNRPGELSSVQYHNARVALDEVQAGLAGQTMTVLADFEGAGSWTLPERRASTNRLLFEPTSEQPSPGGGRGMALTVRFSSRAGVLLETESLAPEPILAIVNWPFLQANKLEPGNEFTFEVKGQELPFVAHSVINQFPTLGVGEEPFVVCNLWRLLEAGSRSMTLPPPTPQEVWVEAASDAARPQLGKALATIGEVEVVDAWQTTSELQTEPLALGLSGGFQLGFLVAWGLSAVGLMIYSVLTARQRSLEFGVLRAVGLSSGQMLRQLASEQAVLIVLALLAGSLLGPGLAQTMQPYLSLALPVQPGSGDAGTVSRIVVDWAAVGQMYLLLIVSLAVALAVMLLVLSRLRLGRVLRLGE